MDLVVLALIIVMQALVLYWVKPAKSSVVERSTDLDIQVALASALGETGLNIEDYGLNHNVRFTGKLGDVLIHASRELNIPMETLGDLHNLLQKAKQ